jgi:hypothetical protein
MNLHGLCRWSLVGIALSACGQSGSTASDGSGNSSAGASAGASVAGTQSGSAGASGTAAGSHGGGAAGTSAGASSNASAGAAGANITAAGASGAQGSAGASGGASSDPTVWPNSVSFTNSDPWISQHHDQITQMNPNVLVLNYANKCGANGAKVCDPTYLGTLVDEHVKAFQAASRYHGYSDASAPPFLNPKVVKIVDLRDDSGNVDSAKLPLATGGTEVDYSQLNSAAYADLIGIDDPQNPGTHLTLCQLFEKGVINEVWASVADPAPNSVKFGESAESKRVYDANNLPVTPAKFVTVGNGPDISPGARDTATRLPCGVTTRIWDFNPTRGSGCHLHSLGHLLENYARDSAVPAFGAVARRFFNLDFDTRFGAPFKSFYDVCPYTDAICINWPSNIHASSGPAAMQSFDFPDMSAGCGNVHFPANATTQYETTGDTSVLTSCANFGLKNGTAGADLTTVYTNAQIATAYGETRQDNGFDNFPNGVASDCGAVQPTYIFGSMPGLGNTATDKQGAPMHNWWVYLFY